MGETSLVRWLRAGPRTGEIQTMQSIGNSLVLGVQQVRAGAYIPIGWTMCGVDFSISVQVEYAKFCEQDRAGVPAACWPLPAEEMLEWPSAAPVEAAAPI